MTLDVAWAREWHDARTLVEALLDEWASAGAARRVRMPLALFEVLEWAPAGSLRALDAAAQLGLQALCSEGSRVACAEVRDARGRLNAAMGVGGPRLGEAWFPVAAGDLATMRLFVAGKGVQCRYRPRDREFLAAVELARSWVTEQWGLPSHEVDELAWKLVPDVPANERIEQGSVGFAAIIAFASAIQGQAVGPDDAWTGCLRRDGGRLDAARIDRVTVPAKLEAIERLGLKRVHLPASNDDAPPHTLRLQGHPDAASLLLGAQLKPPSAPRGRQLTFDRAQRRVLRLLYARAGRPVTDQVLQAAMQAGAWSDGALPDADILNVLPDLLGHVCTEGGRSWLPLPSVEALPGLRDRVDEAHRALAGACTTRRERVLHALLGGATGLCDELRAVAREPDWLDTLEWVVEHTPARTVAVLDKAVAGLAAEGAEGLLRLGWAGRRLGWPVSTVAARLHVSSDPVDQLFGTQCVAEAALHLGAAVAIALGRVPHEGSLARRPSIGELTKAVRSLAEPWDGALAARLCEHLFPVAGALGAVGNAYNEALHKAAALSGLAADRGAAASRRDAVLGPTVAIVEALSRGLAGCVLHERPDGPGCELVDPAGNVLPLGEQVLVLAEGADRRAFFRRGVIEGHTRFWSFDRDEVHWERGAAPWAGGVPGRRRRLSDLPTPLACVVAPGESRNADVLDLLASAEEELGAVLRLAWYATLPALLARGEPVQATSERAWVNRMVVRNLWQEIAGRETTGLPAAFVRDNDAFAASIDGLERLQHGGPPLGDLRERVQEVRGCIARASERAPWAVGAELVATSGSVVWQCSGVRPTRVADSMSVAESLGRPPVDGEVLLLGPDGAFTLWPFAFWSAGGVHVFREARGFDRKSGFGRKPVRFLYNPVGRRAAVEATRIFVPDRAFPSGLAILPA